MRSTISAKRSALECPGDSGAWKKRPNRIAPPAYAEAPRRATAARDPPTRRALFAIISISRRVVAFHSRLTQTETAGGSTTHTPPRRTTHAETPPHHEQGAGGPRSTAIAEAIVASRGALHGPFSLFLHAPEL